MNVHKKLIALLIAAFLTLSLGASAFAASETANFSDVPANAWYAKAVEYVHDNGLMSGTTTTTFEPTAATSRAMLVTVLYRQAGSPVSAQANDFSEDSAQPNIPAAPETPDTPEVPDTQETAITITVGETVIPAILNSSVSARDLISRLPLTVSMTRGSADYYSNLSDPLDFAETDVHSGWHNGDIGFDGTYLTVFHSGEETSSSNHNQITLGRISDLALLDDLGSSIQATFALAAAQPVEPDTPDTPAQRTLVVYYSLSQRTEGVAQMLQEKLGGDIYELAPAEPYTGGNSAISQRAQEEVASGNYPALSGTLPDLSQYDIILIGGPVWSGTMAAPLYTYLQETDFTGKTVAPFWTDQGTPGNYAQDFTAAVQNAGRVTEFLQLTNTTSISDSDMSQRLDNWLASFLA